MEKVLTTSLGKIKGLEKDKSISYLGIKYAKANRFEYAQMIEKFECDIYDATKYGPCVEQYRTYYPHLDIPERKFYHKEFRENLEFEYNEDALNLNVIVPKNAEKSPVLVFIHGGGFNSGSNYEFNHNSEIYAENGVILVSINYRVGVFGYLTHENIFKENNRDGNFGLDDIYTAIRWVKKYIGEFGGDPDNITLIGQSAGAISIQYLCLSKLCEGLFNRVIMLSGGGKFPNFALPKQANNTREYWLDVIKESGAKSFDEFKMLSSKEVLGAVERVKLRRKDNTYNTMPVIDGYLIEDEVKKLIKKPLKIGYMLGYTNCDMFALIMSHISHKFARQNDGYIYYFDLDAPGDNNKAFHSADIRYVFNTLDQSFRPYCEHDYKVARQLAKYISNYAKTGNPNSEELPIWRKSKYNALCINKKGIKMGHPNRFKLLINTFKGDPK